MNEIDEDGFDKEDIPDIDYDSRDRTPKRRGDDMAPGFAFDNDNFGGFDSFASNW